MLRKLSDKLVHKIKNRLDEQNFIDKNATIGEDCYISGSNILGEVSVADHCKIFKAQIDGKVNIGRFTSIWGPNCLISSKINRIEIGSFCSIARNVTILEYNHKYLGLSTYHLNLNMFNKSILEDICSKGDIAIGHDVWIGDGSKVLSGVSIGDGAIVGANAVVNKDVPAYSVVGGCPAEIIKYRFEPEKIKEIQEMRWWEWSIKKITENERLFR